MTPGEDGIVRAWESATSRGGHRPTFSLTGVRLALAADDQKLIEELSRLLGPPQADGSGDSHALAATICSNAMLVSSLVGRLIPGGADETADLAEDVLGRP